MKNGKLNFRRDYKLWKACADDDLRPVMEHVLLKDGYAYASDAHVLVRVPLEECTSFDEEQRELLDGFLIHKSILKYIVGFDVVRVRKGDDGFVYLDARAGENTVTIQLAKDGDALKYPNAEALLQKERTSDSVQKIGINPKFIASLTEAFGTGLLKFEFSDERSAIFVRPADAVSNAVGIVMPFMLTDL